MRIDFPVKEKPFYLIWLGWAITLFLLQTLNLFFPINLFSSIPFLLLGTILAIVFFENEIRKQKAFTFSRIYLVLLVLTTIWIAVLSMSSPTIFDDGLYHFNSIRWLNEYPIVLGLGNLHSRLAFNQSFFAYAAYLNLYPLFNHGYNLANSFLLLVLLAECLWHVSGFVFHRDSVEDFSSFRLIPIFFLPAVTYMALVFEVFRTGISSPAPISHHYFCRSFYFFILSVTSRKTYRIKATMRVSAFILIMSATLITIKLSNLFYVVTYVRFSLISQD